MSYYIRHIRVALTVTQNSDAKLLVIQKEERARTLKISRS